jgi:O-antigen ligase
LFVARPSGGDSSSTLIAVDRLSGSVSTIQSDSIRHTFYSNALSEVKAHPISGIGFQALRASHNLYLELWQSGGVFALLSLCILVGGALSLALRLIRHAPAEAGMENFTAALLASMITWLVCALAQPAVYDRYLYIPIGLLLGLAGATGSGASSLNRPGIGERQP